jgi:hypothetical protein
VTTTTAAPWEPCCYPPPRAGTRVPGDCDTHPCPATWEENCNAGPEPGCTGTTCVYSDPVCNDTDFPGERWCNYTTFTSHGCTPP